MITRRLIILCLLAVPPAARAAENKYDVLGKVLTPFVHLVARQTTSPNRAVTLVLRIESMTDLPNTWIGARAEIALQYPDKLRLRAPILGEDLTICRHGQELWAAPGSRVEALLAEATAAKKLPPLDKKFRLEPFRLPVPEKQLVFFPVLFQVTDAGSQSVNGKPCRVLDLQLMPEIAKSLEASGWSARLWADAEYRPTRVMLAQPGWQATILIDEVQFAPAFPETTWQPTPQQTDDLLKISPARYQQLLKLIGGKRTKE